MSEVVHLYNDAAEAVEQERVRRIKEDDLDHVPSVDDIVNEIVADTLIDEEEDDE